jgi:hypothetical protein
MGTTRLSAEGSVGRGLSPAIWQAYNFIGGNFYDPSLRPMFFDDFANFPLYATTVAQQGYLTVQDTNVTIQQCASCDNSEEEFGIMEIYHDGTQHDEGNIEMGSAKAGLVRIDDTAGERSVVAFEARVKALTVAVGDCCFAIGLGEPGIAAADMIVDTTGALVAKDFVGFQTLLTSNSEIDAVYSLVTTGVVQVTDNAGTLVADTWIKLGFVFDPLEAAGKKLKYFIDGDEITYDTAVTDAVIAAGTAFPTDEELTLCLGTKILTAAATYFYVDWWAVGSYCVDV